MFWPAAANLFALAVFLAGVSTLASSLDQYRWRVIGLVIALYMVSFAIKITGEVLPDWNWLAYTSFLASFEPVKLVADPSTAGPLSVRYDCTLIGLALAAYTLAALVFCRRDLPAPI